MSKDYENEEQETFAYADYYTVIPMIEQYYYKMLELYRIYYELKLNGKENKRLMRKIQSYILVLYDLFRNYNSIKVNEELMKIFNKMNEVQKDLTKMSFRALTICKEAIVNAHFKLGLSDIEREKKRDVDVIRPEQEW
jgi:hypothetical protein